MPSAAANRQRRRILHGISIKNPCTLCIAVSYYCGAVAPRAIAALLGRFLPRLGPLANASGPFFLGLSSFLSLSSFPHLSFFLYSLFGPVIFSFVRRHAGFTPKRVLKFSDLEFCDSGFRPAAR